ncbi:MAG: family N-acetyltransferase [Cyanobacteria bacterium RYN_339]|nr:family N-acetyltransferase [Cyanobacteria bacterium RYN_339]
MALIRDLADYEKLAHEVVGDEGMLAAHLFGDRPAAHVLIGVVDGEVAGFALYFTSYSTFLTRPGIYLEDLFVRPDRRGSGLGKALLAKLAAICVERGYGRLEWSVLDWNEPAIKFYEAMGARPMDGWTVNRVTGEALVALAAREN